jgi:hypothetical protein
METAPRGAIVTGFFKIERYALTLKKGRRPIEGKPESIRKHCRAGNGPAEIYPGKRKHSACKGTRSVATNPECKGAQIFQTSHRQIADVGGRGLLIATELYFLHKIRLNFRALKASQPAREAPVS